MVGNGLSGSGCYINLKKPFHKMLAAFMLHGLGLPYNAIKEKDLETLYLDLIKNWLEESSLDSLLLLAQDEVHSEEGKAEPELSSMYIPNDVVLDICKKNPKFIPAVSIHPARPDAIHELERCKELGAKVMKCLPLYHKINCNHPKYKKFWQKMADFKMPLLVHTGGEKALPIYMPELASPAYLTLPLECGVNVIAAHGGATYNLLIHDYRPVIKTLLRSFPNLYVDNSGMHMLFRTLYFKVFFQEEFKDRVIHGSDLPIPVSSLWVYLHRQISGEAHRECKKVNNPLERDAMIKKAMGFSEDSFTLLDKLINS
jgi:hypothetical protein